MTTPAQLIDALHDSMVGPIHIDQGEPVDFCVDKETPEPQPTSLPMLAVHAFSLLPQDSACNENTVIERGVFLGWLSDVAGVSYAAARGVLAEAVVAGLLELAGPGEDVGDVTWTHHGYDTAATKGWLIHHSPETMEKLCFEDDPEAEAAEAAIARAAEQLVLEAEIAKEAAAEEPAPEPTKKATPPTTDRSESTYGQQASGAWVCTSTGKLRLVASQGKGATRVIYEGRSGWKRGSVKATDPCFEMSLEAEDSHFRDLAKHTLPLLRDGEAGRTPVAAVKTTKKAAKAPKAPKASPDRAPKATAAETAAQELADLAVERITSLEKRIKEQEASIQQQGNRIARLEALLMTFGSAVDSQL
jgi:hypothetical protein